MTKPIRIQLSRKKGWRMPPNTVCVAQSAEWKNPFYIGGYHKIGQPGKTRMSRITALSLAYADATYTFVKTKEQSLAMYREYLQLWPISKHKIEKIRGKNLACACRLDQLCHHGVDILLEIANSEGPV